MERLIRPVEGTWDSVSGVGATIGAWETETGLLLPGDYRRFILGYNGGRPYPSVFQHRWIEEPGETASTDTYVDPFYTWNHVVKWTAELGNRLPQQTLAIGADPGLIEVLLSLRTEDYGTIYSWVRNLGAFGPDNDYLCRQAGSFREFVESLTDNGIRLEDWRLPGLVHLERKLEL